MISRVDYLLPFHEAYKREEPNFRRIFRLPLRPVWDAYTGLDVIKLDEVLGVPDDQSTEAFVRERYGEEGVTLIRRLITIRPRPR